MPRLIHFVFAVLSINFLAAVADQNVDPGEPLFLSKLIADGEISKAQKAALVHEFYPVCGYSGFITVNATHNSNLFFWFFPAEGRQTDNTAPVILWNDGGPGTPGFLSIFLQNGPFTANADADNYTLNPFSWHKKYNMIFMDNPVEVGYSFTENEAGYVTSAPEAARDIYEFLTQFFILFPHLRKNPFYNSGTSYGATYAIQAANYIHQKNLENPRVFINLTGLILDSPWIDPYTQVDYYGDYLFNVGLVSETERDYFSEQQGEFRSLVDQERYLDAFSKWIQIIQLSYNFTGFGAINNIYNDSLGSVAKTDFVTKNETRKALHVGSLNFSIDGTKLLSRMSANMIRSSKPEMETLLAAGYRLLLYVGNMDGKTGHLGVRKLLKSLSWEGASDLISGPRTIWKENGRVAGYNMTASNITFLIVRNAGHCCISEQPEWVIRAVDKFLW